jgi:F-type H+-transporting ATPase subunit delta
MANLNFRVFRRYAKALLDLVQENQITEQAYTDMKHIHAAFEASQELRVLMKSPIVREGKKQRILTRMFEGRVHPLVLQYLRIIVRKQRAALLEGISGAFLDVYNEAMGIEAVRLTTARPVDKALKEKAYQVAIGLTDKRIAFSEVIDPAIIGGFILDLGHRQYDASIRTRLSRLRRHLNV